MFAPGGSAERAAAGRKRLDALAQIARDRTTHMWAGLARGVFDDAHGDPRSAAAGYLEALVASSASEEAQGPLVGWYAVRHLVSLRSSVTDLYARQRAILESMLARPGHIGWRAVAELEDWRAVEVYDKAERTGAAYDDEVTRRMGCAKNVRIAGPFGHGAAPDAQRSFAPEIGAPWPAAWPADPMRGNVPRLLSVTQKRCMAIVDEQVEDGVFYVETFFRTQGDREIVMAVQAAVAVWIDGTLVLRRGMEQWGSWQRFGVHVSVGNGRHRVLARTTTPGTSIRLLNPDGTTADLETDADPRPAVSMEPPRVLADLNPIDAIVSAAAAGDSGLALRAPVDAVLASYAAHVDQMDDVASTLIEPLTAPDNAAPLALEMAAALAVSDPALPEDVRGTRSRSLRERALARDALLWRARATAIMERAEQQGLSEAIDPLRKLADEVRGEPELLEQLAQVYGRLGWQGEQSRALKDLALRFPDDAGALRTYLDVLDENGSPGEADQIASRIKKLDPDAEVDLDRALARRDYKAAVEELNRLKVRRPDRKEIASRIADVLARAGDSHAAMEQLMTALAKHPLDAQARFRLADGAYSRGDKSALRRALAAALQAKANSDALRAAIDLVEGATDLEPFRRDGRSIIRDFQAWEKTGHHMDGTAARVLDYAATWVHNDGSSEMLEHEIQKIQSQEAINAEAETKPPAGLVLHLRVIKPDGRVLEPEPVAGKPSLTLPHLEVGDFIELEHITQEAGDGARGRRYQSPHWFFREADKGYWRSEFVIVTPADRELEIETRGNVTAPQTKSMGTFVERRWRVDLSPPAELEPESPPITEFLPSVRVGWGVSLETSLARLVDLATDQTPLDPRLRSLALDVVRGVPAESTDERARRLYHYVLEHIQEGKETDGRHVLMGKSGSRQAAFRYLLRLIGIRSELAVVKNRLAAPPLGKMGEVEAYDALVMRLTTNGGARWLTIRDKFAPFGYVAAELRGQTAIVLIDGMPREVVRAPGAADQVVYEGRADVREDGSAKLDLVLTFAGNRAIAWRSALDQIPQAKLYDFVERELVAPSFDGGHVREMKADAVAALDQPLVIHLRIEVPELAKSTHGGLALHPPFAPHLAQLAPLPERRTPILHRATWRAEVRVHVVLPESLKMPSQLPHAELRDAGALVVVRDVANGHAIDFDRVIDFPAGRIQPGAEYASWQKFTQQADAVVTRDVLVGK
jgi:tetratricopeptide (TPR) repeat protein